MGICGSMGVQSHMSDSTKDRGVWGSSPRKILEFRSSEIDFDAI